MSNPYFTEEDIPNNRFASYTGISGWLINKEIVKTYKGANILLLIILFIVVSLTVFVINKSNELKYEGPKKPNFIPKGDEILYER